MSDLARKWELIAVENVKEYCEAIGSSPDYVEKALQFLTADNDITQTICFLDNGVSITTEMPGKITKVAGQFGEPIETQFLDDRPIKTVFSLDGNFLREEQTGAFTSSNVRYVEDGQMVYKMTCGDVTTTRRYKRL